MDRHHCSRIPPVEAESELGNKLTFKYQERMRISLKPETQPLNLTQTKV